MRLWQKIFLLTLFLTALAASAISLLLLSRNHRNTLLLAKEKIQAVCDSAVAELGHLIQERKEDSGQQLLTERELEELFAAFGLSSEDFWEYEISITPIEPVVLSVARLPREAGCVSTVLEEQGGAHGISVSTTAFWEGRFYRVKLSGDVSELFFRFGEDLRFCQWMCGGVSLVIATILLFSILGLTMPLKRLETATERIAAGEYGYRVPADGHDEIAELSRHMNAMSEEIADNIRKVEALAASRETFIANMAHELKTPLTSVLGFADIMAIKSHMPEEERRECASIIAAEARRLKALSSKLMELASLQKTALVLRPVDLEELVEKTVQILEPVCREQQCRIRRELVPITVQADEALLASLLLNLLDNALKASALKGAGQLIDVRLGEENGRAIVKVRDYGIGIPRDQLGHVTEAFYMVDKARSRQSGGCGIGLSLSRAIAEAHHGGLEIESREGEGTVVTLWLPVADQCPGALA